MAFNDSLSDIQNNYPYNQYGPSASPSIINLIKSDTSGVDKSYLVIPFEGCGGDAAKEFGDDVSNSCPVSVGIPSPQKVNC